MSNKIIVLNRVTLALGVWAAPCNNDKVSFDNEGFCSQGRHGEEGQADRKGWRGRHRGDLHLGSNITPPGNKQGLHANPL